ncbi:Fe(3+) dicitrate transport protein [Pedobacter westerhofensis]|uniref:Fe(3+) dicitrate transport protein n=1 Tax=Pedobacter westerhofensis TaxID=425512 RepID=A0A521ES69_9SPHI|nr:TonB-dependent receptor [Pedobacter westerhofensis]SMO86776.1 Fe(3+) dicitrate transport protein [Pedobacter westerhofensis]
MKHLYILIVVIVTMASNTLPAQTFTVKGQIKTTGGDVLPNASISFKGTSYTTVSDARGNYELAQINPGSYQLAISAVGYQLLLRTVKVNTDLNLNLTMEELVKQLDNVKIEAEKEKTFGVTRLKAIEGTTINAGKKSEVIVLNDVVGNTATNNTRQIYAKVAGLNIWENDGAGIQLGIGGRGLNPNRITNFNTRQNGYDISADALGYPESYYSPPAELVDRIEILRGAASLQYGTQFGGLINFKLKEGPAADKPLEIISRETTGSWGFFNTTNSIAGKSKKLQYYALFQHKSGDGWRPNSGFNVNTGYASVGYTINDKLTVTLQYTHMNYLAQQPGGLTDAQFAEDPHQSVRARNWFKVDWNLGAAILDYQINDRLKLNSRFFGLLADRDALGDLDFINRPDPGLPRDLYKDKYTNYGNETRLLYAYNLKNNPQNLLIGLRTYRGHTDRQQGIGNNGSSGNSTDFDYTINDANAYSKYNFPNYNVALFAENIFKINPKFSIIPGLRFENIITKANGFYSNIKKDQAGNIFFSEQVQENKNNSRHFVIAGIGLSYVQTQAMQLYGNISQNYRAINFNDIHSANPNIVTDPDLKDEKGYSADLGMRGNISGIFNYDVSIFFINYNNRIGTVQQVDPVSFNIYRLRTNVSQSRNLGFESFAELELLHFITHNAGDKNNRVSLFTNLALINARYVNSDEPAYQNKKVELAPDLIFKTGLSFQHKRLSASYQISYTSEQFTDATNAVFTSNAIDGLIPAYTVMDLSAEYKISKLFTLQSSVNNLADKRYFTRRAESYPGPGIIPADARSIFLTLQIRL